MTTTTCIKNSPSCGEIDMYMNRRGTWTTAQERAVWFRRMADATAFARKTREEIVALAEGYSSSSGTRAALLTSIDWIDRARPVDISVQCDSGQRELS
jgi:hypothetical protein